MKHSLFSLLNAENAKTQSGLRPQPITPVAFLVGCDKLATIRRIMSTTYLASAGTPLLFFATPVGSDFYKQSMPYGVAIAIGAIYVAFTILSVG